MATQNRTEPVSVSELNVGDIISDDIAARITAINRFGFGEVTLHVEDGNGERYMIRTSEDAKRIRFAWSEEHWAAYRAL